MSSVQICMFETQEKKLHNSLGLYWNQWRNLKNALISILKLLSLHPLGIRSSFKLWNIHVFKTSQLLRTENVGSAVIVYLPSRHFLWAEGKTVQKHRCFQTFITEDSTDLELHSKIRAPQWTHPCSNKKALIFMRFEQNDFKILVLSFKNNRHIFWLNSLWSEPTFSVA